MILARLFLFVVLALAPTSAMAITEVIDFDDHNASPADLQTEGVFSYNTQSGTSWQYNSVVGNPASSLISGTNIPTIGDTFQLFLTGGGLFSLTSFDFATAGGPSDTIAFIPVTSGVEGAALCSHNTSNTSFVTDSACSPSTSMDHLFMRITAGSGSTNFLVIDNIALDTVAAPEPASLFLLAAGLFGVVARSRKSKA
jgi:hypothetical protein